MRRPLPTLPRGPRRRRQPAGGPAVVLLTCPRVSPEWEFGALRALMKPHDWTRGAIEHRSGDQRWPKDAGRAVEETAAAVAGRLGIDPPPRVHFPDAGDCWMVSEVEEVPGRAVTARALALALSARLPDLWFTVDRIYARDGNFFRRTRDGTFKLRLVPAPAVHLPRDVRSALRGLL